MLKETVNKKWKPEQITAYHAYLDSVSSYITEYIFTGVVYDSNVFYQVMEKYGT